MLINFYHESFEFNDNYDFKKLGNTGIQATAKRIVCPTCNGDGHHFRKDLDENDMVRSLQEDDDCDEGLGMRAYLRGAFDEICTECKGRNVVDSIDFSTAPEWVEKAIDEWNEDEYLNEQTRFAENGFRY